jgi:hypothetical protein
MVFNSLFSVKRFESTVFNLRFLISYGFWCTVLVHCFQLIVLKAFVGGCGGVGDRGRELINRRRETSCDESGGSAQVRQCGDERRGGDEMSSNTILHSIILQSNLLYSVLYFPLPYCPALSSSLPSCTTLPSPQLPLPHLSYSAPPSLLMSSRFGDAYCEFPKRLRVIEEVRAMVKTIMATDDSAGTSLHHTHTGTYSPAHPLTDCVSHCLRLAN